MPAPPPPILASGPFAAVSIRPVVCFGTVPPGWVQQPFVVDGVSVTWRNHLVEPMLDPVLPTTSPATVFCRPPSKQAGSTDNDVEAPRRRRDRDDVET